MPPTSTIPQPKSLKITLTTSVWWEALHTLASRVLPAHGQRRWHPATEVEGVGRVEHDLSGATSPVLPS
jgi:hypothetical protein